MPNASGASLELVREFHEVFDLPIADEPKLDDMSLNILRYKLLSEELDELFEAMEAMDKVGVLDALTDLQYVLDGAYLALGFAHLKNEALQEVHASNMSKLSEEGLPIYRSDGKVMKGPNYRAPDLARLL